MREDVFLENLRLCEEYEARMQGKIDWGDFVPYWYCEPGSAYKGSDDHYCDRGYVRTGTLEEALNRIDWDNVFRKELWSTVTMRQYICEALDEEGYPIDESEWAAVCERCEREFRTRGERGDAVHWESKTLRDDAKRMGWITERSELADAYIGEIVPPEHVRRLVGAEGVLGAARMIAEKDVFESNRYGRGTDFTVDEIVESFRRCGYLLPDKLAEQVSFGAAAALVRFFEEKCDELEDDLREAGYYPGVCEVSMRGGNARERLRISKQALRTMLAEARMLSDLRDKVMDLPIKTEEFDMLMQRAGDLTLDVEEVAEIHL